jgi:hypothetical protein
LANRPDLLQFWIDLQYNPDCSTPTDKSPDLPLHLKLKDLCQNLGITQEMVDVVDSDDCTKFTKDEVLDQLSR